jgi:hypothetical protein
MTTAIAPQRRENRARGKEWVTADGEERYILVDSIQEQDTLKYKLQQQVISPITDNFSGEKEIVVPKPCVDAALSMKLLVPISQAAQGCLPDVDGIPEARHQLSRAATGRQKIAEHRWKEWAMQTFGESL